MEKNTGPSSSDPDHHFAPPTALSNTDYHHARWPSFDLSQSHPQPPTGYKVKPREREKVLPRSASPQVLVVGVCSSGKSTLVRALKEAGYNARAVAQEHSYIPHLWQLSKPEALVYLDASLHTIRQRRRAKWHKSVLDEEHRRLTHAREHADLYIPTDGLLPEDVASRVVGFLRARADRR